VLAIAGDAGIDDAGVDLLHLRVVEAETVDDAGAEVLDEDIGLGDELLQRSEVIRLLQI
jgi:hypothetical protein